MTKGESKEEKAEDEQKEGETEATKEETEEREQTPKPDTQESEGLEQFIIIFGKPFALCWLGP